MYQTIRNITRVEKVK